MQQPQMQTIQEIKEQLNHCRVELEKAVEQLKTAETQLASAGDASAGGIAGMRRSLESTVGRLGPALDELSDLPNGDTLAQHQGKLANIAGIFQELEALQGYGNS